MSRDVQVPEHVSDPASELLVAVTDAAPRWFRRIVGEAARSGGVDPQSIVSEIDRLVDVEVPRLIVAVADLLHTDVDEQHTNPLSLFRHAVAAPNKVLRDAGVTPPAHDAFAKAAFPDDIYHLGPATWADIDPTLHEPGLVWGAWKAMTILRRRRDEGLR